MNDAVSENLLYTNNVGGVCETWNVLCFKIQC